MKRLAMAALAAIICASNAFAATTLIDTGAPTGSRSDALFGFNGTYVQALAGTITLSQAATISSIQTFGSGSGKMDVAIYAFDPSATRYGRNIPSGTALYATAPISFSVPGSGSYFGASGLDWSLAAGKYWVAFEPIPRSSGGFSGGLKDGVANPLANYAFTSELPTVGAWSADPFGQEQFALRVVGDIAPVPEPGEWALIAGGMAIVGGIARRRRAD